MKRVLVLSLLLLSPLTASATTVYNYTCADFGLFIGSVTCSADTLSFNSTSGNYAITNGSSINALLAAAPGTWYLTFTYAGSGLIRPRCSGDINDCGSGSYVSAAQTDYALTVPSGNTAVKLWFDDDTGGGFAGYIGSICLTDTIGGCSPTPPPTPYPSGTWVMPSFATIMASTSEAANLSIANFLTPFYLIFGLLIGGMFVMLVRHWIWGNGKRIWHH